MTETDAVPVNPDEYQSFKLPRTGDTPVVFEGALIAARDGAFHRGEENIRRVDLSIYRLRDGRYLVHRAFITQWKGESDHHSVKVCNDTQRVLDWLRSWDPIQLERYAVGYPAHMRDHPQFTRKHRGIFEELRKIYADRIADIFETLGLEQRVDAPSSSSRPRRQPARKAETAAA